jgi:hypothetical protein
MEGERRLGMFENSVLRRIFGPKRDEVTGEWRKLHNELNDLYFLPNIRMIKSRRMRSAGQVAHMWERIGAYRVLARTLEGKRPLVRQRRRWGDYIKMDIQEVEWGA